MGNLLCVGAVFDNAPNEPAAVAVQVARIHCDAPSKFCRDGKRATMGIRPFDYIGNLLGDFILRSPLRAREAPLCSLWAAHTPLVSSLNWVVLLGSLSVVRVEGARVHRTLRFAPAMAASVN